MKSFVNFIAMILLLPGFIALVANASLKTHYFDTRPRVADESFTTARTLNGQVIYLTDEEDHQLDLLWHYGVRGLVAGVALWILSCGMTAFHLERYHHSGEEFE